MRFEAAFARHDRRRRQLLQTLTFSICLPDISDKRLSKFQSKHEGEENNRALTDALWWLFRRLHGWGRDATPETGSDRVSFGLRIETASLPEADSRLESCTTHVCEIRNDFSYIEFIDDGVQDLPPATCVDTLALCGGRRLHPRTAAIIASALPRLKTVDWWFYAATRRLHDLWTGLRDATASAVVELAALEDLEDLHLYYEDSDPMNQDWEPSTSLLDSAPGSDGLSVALSRLSKLPRLRKLKLDGLHTLSPAIFDVESCEETTPCWPSLENLDLEISGIAPNGRWYFTGDRDSAEQDDDEEEAEEDYGSDQDPEDSDTSDHVLESKWARQDGQAPYFIFRRHPDPETFDPFITALARAVVETMPVLKQLRCDFIQTRAASITYYAPGQTSGSGSGSKEPVSNGLACGRWDVRLESEESEGDGGNWNPPLEMVRILEAANHRISVTWG